MEPSGSHRHNRRAHAPPGPTREDCWSEGATENLIDAWGDRFVKLNRGNLRQKDWKEVADSVNSRQNGVKPTKTDVQCKNRIDTLKKKYKTEKAKPAQSKWPFYHRLHSLVGFDGKPTKALRPKSKENHVGVSSDGDEEGAKKRVVAVDVAEKEESVELSGGVACRELARAILRFGEVYERVECEKQKKMVELEKERMGIVKEVECERLNMFVVTQLEILKKLKRKKPT